MTITVDFLISFGYGRKYYNEMLAQDRLVRQYDKDWMSKVVQHRQSKGEDPKAVKAELIEYNRQQQAESEANARGVIQRMADLFNRMEMTEQQVQELFKQA